MKRYKHFDSPEAYLEYVLNEWESFKKKTEV